MAGTTQVSLIGFLGYDEETAFADVSNAYDKTLTVRDATLDVSGLSQEMIDRGGVFNRPNDGDLHIPGPHTGATFTFTMDLYGHGSATNGSLTEQPITRLLGHCVGQSIDSQVGGSCTSNSGGADDIISTNVTVSAGGLLRVGALNDGRGNGQAVATDDTAGATYDLLTNMNAAANSGDVIYAMQLVAPDDTTTNAHLTSSGAAVNSTLRFVVATGTQQFVLRGCACTALSFDGLNTADIPTVTFTFSCAFWDDIDVTFPTTTATADNAASVVSNGSFFIQDFGTSTRNVEVIRNFSMSLENEILPITGPGGANDKQVIVGWVRGMSRPTITFDTEAQDATTTPTWSNYFDTDPNSQVFKHALYTLSVTDGRALALYFRKLRPSGARPTLVDVDGLHYVRATFEGVSNASATTALLRAPWVLGLG